MPEFVPAAGRFRRRIYDVVFLSDSPAGRTFDLVLIAAIVASVAVVMLDSVAAVHARHAQAFLVAEWGFTVLFSIEYAARLAIVAQPGRYARSIYGLVDLFSVLPTFVSLVVPGAQVLLVVRILRVLRIFRILKLATYLTEAETLGRALASSRRKILVFVTVVLTLVTVIGALMFVIESRQPGSGFTSIPLSVYWAVVTLTTVGYGDISPQTPLGQALALVLMIMGYGIIAVPTGIVTVELNRSAQESAARNAASAATGHDCASCGLAMDADARFCKRCGTRAPVAGESPVTRS